MNQERRGDKLEDTMEQDVPNPGTANSSFSGTEPSLLDQPTQQTEQQTEQTPPSFPTSAPVKIDYSQSNIDEIEELIESVVDEKWRTLMENVGDIGLWKDKVRTEVVSIKQELVRLENRFENLQKAILGKVKGYDENMVEVGSQVKALEKVFSKILDPLTTNIKELGRITQKLKK